VGLELAADVLREGVDNEAFALLDSCLADYLTIQLLEPQSERTRRFLLSTSVLGRMSGALCDAVTSGHRSQATLEELERTGTLIFGLDSRSTWFRYHPSLRVVLRCQLHDEDAALETLLLHRAAEWHLARGDLEEGVGYLAEAGAWEEVVDAAFTHGAAMFDAHRAVAVAEWLQHLPPTFGEARVRVALLES